MAIKCNACNGLYDATTADGLPYYHACAPVRRLRVQELDGTYSTVVAGTEGARIVVGERLATRPNFRNENLAPAAPGAAAAPIAVGTGVTLVPDNLKT